MIDLEMVDEDVKNEFLRLQKENEAYNARLNEVQQGVAKIINNPKAAEYLKNAVKEAGIEGVNIPESPITQHTKPLQDEIAKMRAEQEQKRLWDKLKAKGLTEELENIKKFAKDNGINNDDAAIDLYEKTKNPPEINRSVQYDNPFKERDIEMDDDKIMQNIMAGLPYLRS